jgi:hypothetical protein
MTTNSGTSGHVTLLPLMGEDFDFDDDHEMRRRLPRLSACCLGSSPLSEQGLTALRKPGAANAA